MGCGSAKGRDDTPPVDVKPSSDAPHVVLSTFEEPWYTIGRGVKEILEEKGCTVYHPMDNKERKAFNDHNAS